MWIKTKILPFDIASFGIGGGGIAIGLSQAFNTLAAAGGVILLGLQIYLITIRIKKEKKAP
jgi:hypothetical protein